MKLTKLEVAERQLSTAIDLYFSGCDLVSAWTLGAASYNILRDIKKARNEIDMMLKDQLASMARLDVNRNENFFKHADRDQEAVLEFVPRGQIELLLFDAGTAYYWLVKRETPQMVIARMWFLANAKIEHEGGEEFEQWLQATQRLPEESPVQFRQRFWPYAVRCAATTPSPPSPRTRDEMAAAIRSVMSPHDHIPFAQLCSAAQEGYRHIADLAATWLAAARANPDA